VRSEQKKAIFKNASDICTAKQTERERQRERESESEREMGRGETG
jgi:hypothetical protein